MIFLLGLLTCLRDEAPKYFLYEGGSEAKARKEIHKIYETGGSEYEATRIATLIKGASTRETANVTLQQAFCSDERYMRASWTALAVCFFVIMDGGVAIWLYANQLYETLLGDNDPIMTARTAVYATSVTMLVGALFSMLNLSVFGRKTILLWGHALAALSLVAVGVSV